MRPDMPNTASSVYRRSMASNVLLVMGAISLTFILTVAQFPHLVFAQEENDDTICPGATTVTTLQGNTSQESERFDINAQNWQIVVETESNGEFSFTSVDAVEAQSFSTVATQTFNNGQSGVINVQGSGRYYVDVLTDLQSFDITVQECGGSEGGEVEDTNDVSANQYAAPGDRTPGTGGPPLFLVVAALVWIGVAGILISRRVAARTA